MLFIVDKVLFNKKEYISAHQTSINIDIFEWIFKKRPDERHIPQIESLRNSIKTEINLFDELWQAYSERRCLLRAIQKGKFGLLKQIPH